ncbi:MAG TPA: hypothetical protein VG675_25470 [Bryobacteraceae bacterium]|nr:hypothetical protein [Bryobacteraceae bacterium]
MIVTILLLAALSLISPTLREGVSQVSGQTIKFLNDASPYSYIGLGVSLLGGILFARYAAQTPRSGS